MIIKANTLSNADPFVGLAIKNNASIKDFNIANLYSCTQVRSTFIRQEFDADRFKLDVIINFIQPKQQRLCLIKSVSTTVVQRLY